MTIADCQAFKHEDLSAQSLSYLENEDIVILICKGFTCGLHYFRRNNVAEK